ncbi:MULTISPECIES: hypothetical protein [Salimicrobium]|uniref:DUF4181 domain-containing protein n=2 Tax=Salimicrobium TaxID=351195 RepID=A0ABY1KNL8_9BACI|nr:MULTISPECIES: hypothetical protein [Salimicrobium]SDX39069.1 hypothetical protein SAMN04488081_0372 [Salimicrobium album]SIS46802.1 hypothetical protein SAMN05421758_101339 [Salimicrobium salexigens]
MTAVIGVVLVVIFHITVSEVVLKRKWGIEPDRTGMTWAGRDKRFVVLEVFLLIAAFTFLFLTGGADGMFFVVPLLLAAYFLSQVIEARRGDDGDRSYYYDGLAVLSLLLMTLFSFLGTV